MPRKKKEPLKHEVKQYKPCPVRKNQRGVYSNKETMPSNDEIVKHEVKQYKPCQVMMNQWNMT
jgi:hypothetical protein